MRRGDTPCYAETGANTEEPVPCPQVRKIELLALVEKAQAGDQAAFEEICLRFRGLVLKYARQPHIWRLGDEAEAEGWLAVVRSVKTYRASAGVQVAGYIESQVKYALWNLYKKTRRRWERECLPEGDEDKTGSLAGLAALQMTERLYDAKETAGELRILLASLPAKQRQAVVLTVLQGRRLAEVAAGMGISPQAVHNLQKRGLLRLKKLAAGMYQSEGGEQYGSG